MEHQDIQTDVTARGRVVVWGDEGQIEVQVGDVFWSGVLVDPPAWVAPGGLIDVRMLVRIERGQNQALLREWCARLRSGSENGTVKIERGAAFVADVCAYDDVEAVGEVIVGTLLDEMDGANDSLELARPEVRRAAFEDALLLVDVSVLAPPS